MSKEENKTSKTKKNVTFEKLAGTPFKSASELAELERKIQREIYEELLRAKAIHEYLKRDEFKFYLEKFEKGMCCRYGDLKDEVVDIHIDSQGKLIIVINRNMQTKGHSEKFITGMAQALADSFYGNYLKAVRTLPIEVSGDPKKLADYLSGGRDV